MKQSQFYYLLRRGLFSGGSAIIKSGLVMFNKFTTAGLSFPAQGSAAFNGTSDYITTEKVLVPTGAEDFTIMAWVNRNSNTGGSQEILSQWISANSGNSFFFGFNLSNVRFSDGWNNIVVAGAGDLNKWFHLCGVNDGGSNSYIYLDGSLKATQGAALTYTGQAEAIIGRQGALSSEYFNGNLANVAIWNRALSSDEINSVMWKPVQALSATESNGLQAWYSLDDIASPTASLASMEQLATDKNLTIENKAAVTAAINSLS